MRGTDGGSLHDGRRGGRSNCGWRSRDGCRRLLGIAWCDTIWRGCRLLWRGGRCRRRSRRHEGPCGGCLFGCCSRWWKSRRRRCTRRWHWCDGDTCLPTSDSCERAGRAQRRHGQRSAVSAAYGHCDSGPKRAVRWRRRLWRRMDVVLQLRVVRGFRSWWHYGRGTQLWRRLPLVLLFLAMLLLLHLPLAAPPCQDIVDFFNITRYCVLLNVQTSASAHLRRAGKRGTSVSVTPKRWASSASLVAWSQLAPSCAAGALGRAVGLRAAGRACAGCCSCCCC
jgi:hypothetical protein